MKYTLLDLTQTILSSMDGDQVNSISDSTESLQVANVIRTAYYDIIGRSDLPEHYDLITLDASTDSSKPVLMTLPAGVVQIKWLKYNNATITDTDLRMEFVKYLPPDQFLDLMDGVNESDANIDTFNHTSGSNTYKILYRNDVHPQYYTSFDDVTLIFDSYDNTVDATLQKSKTRAYGRLSIPFTMSDTFTPDLDEAQFALLLNEAKALAWAELKQSPHPKAELNARRAWTNLQKHKNSTEVQSDFDQLSYFGRK